MPKEYYLYVNGQRVKFSEQIYKVYWREKNTKSIQSRWVRKTLAHFFIIGSCGGYCVDTKDVNLEILHFKQFYKHFVFDKGEEGYVKKDSKNYMDVRVVL